MATVINKLEKVFLGFTGTAAGVVASGCYLTSSAAAVAAATSIKLMIQNWESLTKGKSPLIEKDVNIFGNPFIPGSTSGPWQTGLSIGSLVAGMVFTRLAWSAFGAINSQPKPAPVPKNVVPLSLVTEETPNPIKETTRGFGRHR